MVKAKRRIGASLGVSVPARYDLVSLLLLCGHAADAKHDELVPAPHRAA